MHVAIVGGGIAGLTAAERLADGRCSVTLLEASGRFGGQIGTEHHGGFVVERGAEGFVARSVVVPELCRRSGLGADLVAQATRRSLAWRDGRLAELGEGEAARLLGIPVDTEDLGRGLFTLTGGMGALVDAMVRRLEQRASLRVETQVTGLQREGAGWRLDCAGSRLEADAVILALPPREAAMLLAPIVEPEALEWIRFESVVTVSLAYSRTAVTHALGACGFVVDGTAPEGLRACTFSSSKFPGRASAGCCLLRAFLTPGQRGVDQSDQAWSGQAHRVLTPILGLAGRPLAAWIDRWPAALPRYSRGPAEARAGLRRRLRQHGPIALAGGALDGGGVDGAVRSGLAAAARISGETRAAAATTRRD